MLFQNNLEELHAVVNFFRPHFFGDKLSFRSRFSQDIADGSSKDATPQQIKRCKTKMAILHRELMPFVHRRKAELLSR